MTTIAGITIQAPARWRQNGYDVNVYLLVASEIIFDELRELFSLCDTTSVQLVPGRRPIPFDPTVDELNVVYVDFTHGEKPEDGYYLLRAYNAFEDESPEGLARIVTLDFSFLGSLAYYQAGFYDSDLDSEDNDWGI
jgi:hypothetical protein